MNRDGKTEQKKNNQKQPKTNKKIQSNMTDDTKHYRLHHTMLRVKDPERSK